MSYYAFILLFTVVALTGCTSTRTLGTDSSDVGFSALNEVAQRKPVRVLLLDRRAFRAHDLYVDADSLSFRDGQGSRYTVASSEVDFLEVKRRGRGLQEGALIGLLVGSAVGGLLGLASYDGSFFESAAQASLFGAIALDIVSVPVGSIIGLARGHRDVYRFEEVDKAASE